MGREGDRADEGTKRAAAGCAGSGRAPTDSDDRPSRASAASSRNGASRVQSARGETMKTLRFAAVLATAALSVMAQAPPAFEAASVKRHPDPNERVRAFQVLPSGRVHIVNLPLEVIISMAYELPFQSATPRLSGGPEWTRSETYDIE